MLSKDFIVLVAISCAVAIPASFHFMTQWLQYYGYRWIFISSIAGAVLVTMVTISQTIRAAIANPVNSLR